VGFGEVGDEGHGSVGFYVNAAGWCLEVALLLCHAECGSLRAARPVDWLRHARRIARTTGRPGQLIMKRHNSCGVFDNREDDVEVFVETLKNGF
jgi:hypothetical protein